MSNCYFSSSMMIMCTKREQVFSFSLVFVLVSFFAIVFSSPILWWWSGCCPLSEPWCAQSPQSCKYDSLWPRNYNLPGSLAHESSQARIPKWAGHALLQGFFPTQGLNRMSCSLLHGRWILFLPLSQWGSPIEALINILTSLLILYIYVTANTHMFMSSF